MDRVIKQNVQIIELEAKEWTVMMDYLVISVLMGT